MQKKKSFLVFALIGAIAVSCSKNYQVDGNDIDDPQSSGIELSSGELASSNGVVNSSQVILSSGQLPLSSGSVSSSSSVLVVDPDTLRWIGNSPIQITEIDPNNLTWTDHLGEDPGWVEVYNPSDKAVSLKGYSFVENLTTPRKWVFGDVSIPAKTYQTIFCSNLDLSTPPASTTLGVGRAHTNWRLEKKGGSIYLLDSSLGIRDSLQYPSIPVGASWGSLNSKWGFFSTITPEEPNSTTQYAKISDPIAFGSGGGFFTTAQSIAIPSTSGTVRCTQDGSEPTESSPVVNGSVVISKNTVLRCASFEAGAIRGPISTQTYFINETVSSIPVISIAVDPVEMFDEKVGLYMPGPNAGNYSTNPPAWNANFYKDTKLAVHVEYYGRDKKLKWKSDAGLNMMGNYSRMFPKKSVSIKFSENFNGSALDYPLFPSHPNLTKFKNIVLRNGGNNFEMEFIRDPLQCTSVEGLGVDYQKSDYVLLFYNGVYHGIFNLREKMNEDFIKTNYDIDASTVDVISLSGKDGKPIVDVSAGTQAAWDELFSFLSSSSMTSEENYAKLKTMVDVENYANYVGAQIYFRNTDWPGNNLKMWRTNNPAGPFKFMIFDTDHGYAFEYADGYPKDAGFDMFNLMECKSGCPNWPNPEWSTRLYRKLMENATWKPMFINRMATMLSYWFTPTRMKKNIADLSALIQSEIKRDLDVYGEPGLYPEWYPSFKWSRNEDKVKSEESKMRTFADERPAYVRDQMRSHFELGEDASLTISTTGPGTVAVHGLVLPANPFTGSFFNGYGVELTAVANTGATFAGWSDGVQTVTRTVVPGLIGPVTAKFQ